MGSGGHGSLVQGSAGAVYLIQGNLRRHVPDPETFNAMGLKWSDVQGISDDHLNGIGLDVSLPSRKNGALIQGSGEKAYWMENGQRRHIPDPETFAFMGLNLGAIQRISDDDLNDIPQSGSLPSRKNGALVQGSEGKVYWMENGQRRHIPNPETFNSMGLNWGAIQNVSDADLNMIPLGSPLPPVQPKPGSGGGSGNSPVNLAGLQKLLYGSVSATVTAHYGFKNCDIWGSVHSDCTHPGIDFAATGQSLRKNPPIYSPVEGVVTGIDSAHGLVYLYNQKSNITFRFLHMKSRNVSTGQTVSKGQQVGTEGRLGYATGDHLHFDARPGWHNKGYPHYSQSINPVDAVNRANS
jgi:murein DD-endopeptidase MepM/ murein hydrolase activator NlpD